MISVICVYNSERILDRHLRASLRTQSARHELIAVDNTGSGFKNAPSALNWGAARAHGDWLIFVHQDVSLLGRHWLERTELMLRTHNPSGWWGVAGADAKGGYRGFMIDRAALLGAPFDDLHEVQTLDECLLIHRRGEPGRRYFDENIPSWHAY